MRIGRQDRPQIFEHGRITGLQIGRRYCLQVFGHNRTIGLKPPQGVGFGCPRGGCMPGNIYQVPDSENACLAPRIRIKVLTVEHDNRMRCRAVP